MFPMSRTGSQRDGSGAPEEGSNGWNVAGPQQQQQQQALGGLEPVPPLQQSENRWTSATRSKLVLDENSLEFAERKIKALLNKLALKNFHSVSNQVIDWANKSENENNSATLILVIKLVYEQVTDEAHWPRMYALLCRKMMEQISCSVQDENIRNYAGEPIVGGHLFRKYLLNRCQEDFERGWSQKESAQAAATLKAVDDKAAEAASKAGGEVGSPSCTGTNTTPSSRLSVKVSALSASWGGCSSCKCLRSVSCTSASRNSCPRSTIRKKRNSRVCASY